MSSKHLKSRLKYAAYVLISFILSLVLFTFSLCIVFQSTVLNPGFIIDNMNSTSYFTGKNEEITRDITDLGYASGLNEEFFVGLTDEIMLSEDTQSYLDAYFASETTSVSSEKFSEALTTAIYEYIKENNIENVNSSSMDYFIKQAADIYSKSLNLPLFGTMSPYLPVLKRTMPFVIIGLIIVAAGLAALIYFTNIWKHRAMRYYFYASSGNFLALAAIPIVFFASGIIRKINLTSRSLYSLVISCADNMMFEIMFCALFFLILSIAAFIGYRKLNPTLNSSSTLH